MEMSKLTGNQKNFYDTHMKPRFLYTWHFLVLLPLFLYLIPGSAAANDSLALSGTLEVESIEISGNTRTRSPVILSFFDFTPGERITRDRLDGSTRRIKESDFFKEVNVFTQPGRQRGSVVIYVEVKERKWPYFQFKGGYNELDGWYLSPIGLRFDNIFGRGNYMGIEFYIGDRLTGLDISYFRPDIFNSGLNFRARLYSRSRQFVHYPQDEKFFQKVDEGGLALRLNRNQGLLKYLWFDAIFGSVTARDEIRSAEDKNDTRPLPPALETYSGKNPVARFVVSLNVDTRDQPFYPRRGVWGTLSVDQVIVDRVERLNYNKWTLDIRAYRELVHGVTVAGRGKAGWIDDEAPFFDKFYLGGPNSLRGYEERRLNPLGFASRLVQGSAELRFPLTTRNFPRHLLTGVIFYDLGESWAEPARFEYKELHSGVGYGFRLNLPFIGLLRIDFAYPVPEYDLRIHVSLGHMF